MRTQNGEEIHLKKTEGDAEEVLHVKRAKRIPNDGILIKIFVQEKITTYKLPLSKGI